MKNNFNFSEVKERLGVNVKSEKLLKTAFTHSSFANENKVESNERLEFLGDSVLGFIVTEKIYKKTHLNEGNLSKLRALLVSEKPLAEIIDKLDLERFMLKGVGETKNKVISNAIKCDLYEAIVGALYLDSGIGLAREFVEKTLNKNFEELAKLNDYEDAKTKLQETLPYKNIKYYATKKGDEFNPVYFVEVKINNVVCGTGQATSKRAAEQIAASVALKKLKEK
ncbi:MAG: ribonuclease III [Clostridia bacterium]|nr:ribonuclease III [Clostridia bacterium]